jgi:hypothetical protein
MFCQRVPFVTAVALVAAALLLTAGPVLAGDRYRAPPPPPQPAPPPPSYYVAARPAASVSVVVTPQRVPAPRYVSIRSPDGQVRRFAVEGGLPVIQPPAVVVLRPGSSVTFYWLAAK